MGFMMSDLKDNYWAMGIELTRYFEENAKKFGFKKVGLVADMGSINSQTTPAIYIFNSDNTLLGTVEHIDDMDAQYWTVVVAVSHANAQLKASNLMIKSGGIIGDVLNHVRGFHPEYLTHHTPLERTRGRGKPVAYKTFGLYPFTFKTTFSI